MSDSQSFIDPLRLGVTTDDDPDAVLHLDQTWRLPAAAGGGAGDWVLIDTWTFSGAASSSRDNVFTATYENYWLVVDNLVQATATARLFLRMRASSTDTTTNYHWSRQSINDVGTVNSTGDAAVSEWELTIALGAGITASDAYAEALIIRPQLVARSFMRTNFGVWRSTTTLIAGWVQGVLNNTTQYDGLSLVSSSGNISGKAWLYGLVPV